MTTLDVEDGRVVIRCTGGQAVMALARSVTVPIADVRTVEVVADGFDVDLGWRVGGTSVAKRLAFGRFRTKGGVRTFAALYAGEPAVVIETTGGNWDRIVVTLDEPERAADAVRAAAAATG